MVDPDLAEGGRRVIPPSGIQVLVVAAWVVVLGLTVINARQGDWELVVTGAIFANGLNLIRVSLRRLPKA